MTRREQLIDHVFRLIHLTRSVMMKRALTAVDANPHLNFWRLIQGNQLDIAVLEWCKVFGSENEATHWKEMKRYRDNLQCTTMYAFTLRRLFLSRQPVCN